MCHELVTGEVPLLIPTPNAIADVGNNIDKFLFNPDLLQVLHLSWFKFLGENFNYYNFVEITVGTLYFLN